MTSVPPAEVHLIEHGLSVYTTLHPNATPGGLRSIILGEAVFGACGRVLGDSRAAAGHLTYTYAFGRRPPALDGHLGATHIVELPFVFDNMLAGLHGGDGLLGPRTPATPAARVHPARVDLVATGTPGRPEHRLDRRTTQLIGNEWTSADDPFAAERGAWTRPHHT
jgi:para-nitrobenzyl esterase